MSDIATKRLSASLSKMMPKSNRTYIQGPSPAANNCAARPFLTQNPRDAIRRYRPAAAGLCEGSTRTRTCSGKCTPQKKRWQNDLLREGLTR
jgi:hypothetical protein